MEKMDLPLFNPVRLKLMEDIAVEVIRSGNIASGANVEKFENAFGLHIQRAHVVGTSDMTAAIVLALKIIGVKSSDEVAAIAFSCLSTTSAIAIVGACPLWIDINPVTMSMSTQDLKNKISSKTKAVILYHIAGYPADVHQIKEICLKRSVPLIEDCNSSLGGSIDGRPIGLEGDFAVYSFYPNRQINGLEGGALACSDPEAAAEAKRLRRYGIDGISFRDSTGEINQYSKIPEIGIAGSLNQVNAAVALCQISTLNERQNRVNLNAAILADKLKYVSGLQIVNQTPNSIPAYWCFLIHIDARDHALASLKAQGIQCSKLHYRNDIYTGFKKPIGNLPGTETAQKSILAIPCGWWLNEIQINFIIKTIIEIQNKRGAEIDDQ